MKTWQFIMLLIINLLAIWFWVFSFLNLSKQIDSINIPQCDTAKNDWTYHIDEKELNRLLYTIEEDAHFCRAGIQAHRERRENWAQDFTKLFLNANY